MKLVTTLISVVVNASVMETIASRTYLNHAPTIPVDLIRELTSQSERVLQIDVPECPICGHLSEIATLNPDKVPFPEYPDYTCGTANLNVVYEANYQDLSLFHGIPPTCNHHRETYEEICCELSESVLESTLPHTCEENIQFYVLPDSYVSSVAPSPGRGEVLLVNALISLWLVSEVDIKTGKIELFVDIRLSWNDPRLAWNITSENCATSTFVRASLNFETTNIWVPSIDLGNRNFGVQSLEEAPAKVYSDGTVVWVRTGKISPFCSFIGLGRMPYDQLGCEIIFLETMNQKVIYNLVDLGDQSTRGIQFPEYNQTYTEYRIIKKKTVTKNLSTVFSIELYFSRSVRQYTHIVLLPTIFFVYMSFGQFFFDSASAERISFCATTLLIVVAQNIVSSGYLPMCEERIWLSYLTTSCQYFVLVGIFEALLFYSVQMVYSRKVEKRKGDDSSETNIGGLQNNDVTCAPCVKGFLKREGQHVIESAVLIMKWVDRVAMYLLPLSFSVFLIVMFATNKSWEDDPDKVWQL